MKRRTSFFSLLLKGLIALATILNLIILLVFPEMLPESISQLSVGKNNSGDSYESSESYSDPYESSEFYSDSCELSESSSESLTTVSEEDTQPETAADTEDSFYSIKLEKTPLHYDGSDDLDLLSGVSVISSDGDILEIPVSVSVQAGDTLSQKVLLYSADTELGQISASRSLVLENYKGPSIKLPSKFSSLEETQLNTLLSDMPIDGSFRADDGYGNDITDEVTFTYTIDEQNLYTAHLVFTVINRFNDSASITADVTLLRPVNARVQGADNSTGTGTDLSKRPILTLTTDEVVIKRYETFRPFSYIESAVDVDGSSLMEHIGIQGSVDTSTPGEYTLTYTIYPPSGNVSVPRTLKVTVE